MIILAVQMSLAAPVQLAHQGRVLDAAGGALNGTHSVTVTLFDGPASSTVIWDETRSVDFADGYYTLALGADSGNALDTADLDGATPYIGLAVGTDALGPRVRVATVPYAAVAGTVSGGALTGPIVVTGTLTADSITSNGQITAADPIADGHVATRGYVEAATDDLAVLLERMRWREDCYADFDGWPDADACMHDGRWHAAAVVDASGTWTTGSFAILDTLLQQGADLRIKTDDFMFWGYHTQFHDVPGVSGEIVGGGAIWIRVSPTPMTYEGGGNTDFQDKMILVPATGKPEWGQSYYGDCGAGRTWANYGFFEGGTCNIERMDRNNWEADINKPVTFYVRF